jgi:hypothetical protein
MAKGIEGEFAMVLACTTKTPATKWQVMIG